MKIELAYLIQLGLSQKALEFYSSTDPLVITKNNDGSFDASGCIPFHANDDADLINTLEQLAADI